MSCSGFIPVMISLIIGLGTMSMVAYVHGYRHGRQHEWNSLQKILQDSVDAAYADFQAAKTENSRGV